MSSHTVTEEADGIRIDTFLSQQLDAPRNKIQQIIRKGRVWVGTTIATKPSRPIRAGEEVTITDGWETREFPPAENLPVSILFEDEYLIVLNKPAGQVVHPISKEGRGTVINALIYYFPQIIEAVYDPESQVSLLRPGVVHRLDKDTSGLLLIAKTKEAMEYLSQQFKDHTVEKEYTAFLYGNLVETSDVLTSMRRQKKGNVSRMKAHRELGQGREAHSVFVPTAHFSFNSKIITEVSVRILTGRTHQIRSHARYLGHPVLGDLIYGTASSKYLSSKLGVGRHMLHAKKLTFNHPANHGQMSFEAPLPTDIIDVCRNLEHIE